MSRSAHILDRQLVIRLRLKVVPAYFVCGGFNLGVNGR